MEDENEYENVNENENDVCEEQVLYVCMRTPAEPAFSDVHVRGSRRMKLRCSVWIMYPVGEAMVRRREVGGALHAPT